MILSDSYFKIGSSHLVCQDYAMDSSGNKTRDSGYVAISDGCSSNTHSDFGSRVIVKEAMNQMANNCTVTSPEELIHKSKVIFDILKLHPSHLNATLLTVSAYGDSHAEVQVFGDGVIVARERETKNLYVIDLEYPSGAPCYLSYRLSSDIMEGYKKQFGTVYKYTATTITAEGEIKPIAEMELPEMFFEETFDYETYDLITVLSDGIHSFQHKEISPLPCGQAMTRDLNYLEVIKELFQFKSMNGVFVNRRCNKFFKQCKKNNWIHYDDFSIAGVYHGGFDDNI